MKRNKMNRLLLIVTLLTACPFSLAYSNEKSEEAVKLLRVLCLAGSDYELDVQGDGSVKIFKRAIKGSVVFSKKELAGVVDISTDENKLKELNEIRQCIKPHIGRILDSILTSPLSKKK